MLVSVLTITYNQERYLAQALDSILMQAIDADLEIVVGDDASSDGTGAILRAYRDRHPGQFRLLLRDRNVGLVRNFAETLLACRGRYVAILEGDDFWTSPDKLRTQVEFLESHPECSACFHNVEVVYEDAGRESHLFHRTPPARRFLTLQDVLRSHPIPTPSTMFRRGLIERLPEWFYSMPMGDWPLHVLNARQGPIGYIDAVLACYRVHGAGSWSSQGRLETLRRTIEAAGVLRAHLDGACDRILRRSMARWNCEIAAIHYEAGRIRDAGAHARAALEARPGFSSAYRRAQWLRAKAAVRGVLPGRRSSTRGLR
jgi:glycosyltransferase involved in cell wall biosynthesis